jgi:hypothetical protein
MGNAVAQEKYVQLQPSFGHPSILPARRTRMSWLELAGSYHARMRHHFRRVTCELSQSSRQHGICVVACAAGSAN